MLFVPKIGFFSLLKISNIAEIYEATVLSWIAYNKSACFTTRLAADTSSVPLVTDLSTTLNPYFGANLFKLFTSETEFCSDEL